MNELESDGASINDIRSTEVPQTALPRKPRTRRALLRDHRETVRELETVINVQEQELASAHKDAHTDALTSLPDKERFLTAIENRVREAETTGNNNFHLIFMDFKYFKAINDTYGHPMGDEILRIMPALKGLSRAEEPIYRYGGDEFVQIVEGISSEQEVFAVARRYQTLISSTSSKLLRRAPIQENKPEETPIRRSARLSIGVAPYTGNESAADLIAIADGAMYHAKKYPRGIASIAHTDHRGGRRYTQQAA
jgi:diguanylate cyclase